MEKLLNAIYGFELIVLSYFIAYTVFPQFRACIHRGIDTFVKWSGFISLCLSLSILMINLMFNQKLNNQIMLEHVFKWQLLLAISMNIIAFHTSFRPFITSLLIAALSYKAYFFKVETVDLILFTSFSISMLNSVFYHLNRYSKHLGIQSILSCLILTISLIAIYNQDYILLLLKANKLSYKFYKIYGLLCLSGSIIGLVSFIMPRLLGLSLFILPMVLSLFFMYTGTQILLVIFFLLLFLSAISWTIGFNQKQVV